MAKSPEKKVAKKIAKKAPAKSGASSTKAKASTIAIDKVMHQVLEKLSQLGIDQRLQDDIKWCLGSYGYDKNPVGLFETGARALVAFTEAKAKNAKAVPTKLVNDLKKALKAA